MNAADYNQCVDLYSDAVFRFALKNLRDKDMANDIVQTTFEKLWIKHLEVDVEKAKSYLFTIAYNAMVDYWRTANRTTEITETMENKEVKNAEYKGLKAVVEMALSKLPEIQKTVVMLRDYEGYSYEEIGEITHLNESQVKVYIFRARQTMKQFIGSLEAVL